MTRTKSTDPSLPSSPFMHLAQAQPGTVKQGLCDKALNKFHQDPFEYFLEHSARARSWRCFAVLKSRENVDRDREIYVSSILYQRASKLFLEASNFEAFLTGAVHKPVSLKPGLSARQVEVCRLIEVELACLLHRPVAMKSRTVRGTVSPSRARAGQWLRRSGVMSPNQPHFANTPRTPVARQHTNPLSVLRKQPTAP